MNKQFITALVLCYVCAVYCRSSPYTGLFSNRVPVLTPCLSQAQQNCQQTVFYKWIKNEITQKLTTAYMNRDHDKADELQTQLTCCIMWDTFDCFEDELGVCNPKELESAKVGFGMVTRQLQATTCADYKYHSTQCSSK